MWLKENYRTIIRLTYIIPILFAAGVSIAHVIAWYGITNPVSWAIYLSVGIEIAALSALAGMTAKMNKWVYFPFLVVTLIQLIGNVFFSFQFIDVAGPFFKSWVELVSPLFDMMGMASPTDLLSHKRWLAVLSGGLIPVISLSFLHLLISFNDKEEDNKEIEEIVSIPSSPLPDMEIIDIFAAPATPNAYMYKEEPKDIPTDLFIPKIESIEFPEPESEPEIEELEIEVDITADVLPTETQNEAISEPIDIHEGKPVLKELSSVIGDKMLLNRMSIQQVGTNKIIRDTHPNQVHYKKQ